MKFGHVPEQNLDKVDFSLPADSTLNNQTFAGKPAAHPQLYIGCGRWGMPQWKGTFYPDTAKEKDYPQYYMQHFNCLELNATLYRPYPKQRFEEWASWAGDRNFK